VAFERRELTGDVRALVSEPLERIRVLAAFLERTGGASAPPYDTLDVSLSVGDEQTAVMQNRQRVCDALDIPPYALVEQVHGAKIVRVGAKRAGAGFEPGSPPVGRADGMSTASERLPLAIQTADCVPLVLASADEPLVAIVHAGWKGFAAGILDVAAALFAEPKGVRAAIGPTIGPDHYEVGEDVALAVSTGSSAGAVTETRGGKLFLDLPGTAKRVLRAAGVTKVEDTGVCTACEPERYFSHRRDGVTGRQVAIAMRMPTSKTVRKRT
jgi:purine-nucleoside/S-methyl-5'-thioadenosine phosphorylase / adenosine deaminase